MNSSNLSLNVTRFVVFLLGIFVFSGCSEDSRYEKSLKKSINLYLDKNLKDPTSLKDLKITYAFLSQEDIDVFHDKQLEKYKTNPSETVLPLATIHVDKEAIVLIDYRAKNSYGAYDQGMEAFKYFPFGNEWIDLQPLEKSELYLVDAMLNSSNKKSLK
ncbi:MAG: hypothetical protein MJZ94_06190 [Bacteroidales bacterium]|nr:hypothetical protein [Bacteroidales bacterium]